jgi:hypothetical protein
VRGSGLPAELVGLLHAAQRGAPTRSSSTVTDLDDVQRRGDGVRRIAGDRGRRFVETVVFSLGSMHKPLERP